MEIPRQNSNDYNPMRIGDQVYFMPDRNGRVTLFSYDTRSKQVMQVLENQDYDFKTAVLRRILRSTWIRRWYARDMIRNWKERCRW